MAESSTPALPGVEWLPGPVLRILSPVGEAPTLVLRSNEGEWRITARADEYALPPSLRWSAAWLEWGDGTRVAIPPPHDGAHAEVIELRPRRAGRSGRSGARPAVPPPPPPARPAPLPWTAPPVPPASEGQWGERHTELNRALASAAAALARARDSERAVREEGRTALAAARADARAARAAREADASALAALTGELEAERAAHAVTRGTLSTLAEGLSAARAELTAARTELATARTEAARVRGELASLREALEHERRARAAAEAALREPAPSAAGRSDLERHAREQAAAAAAAARKPNASLLANLEAAAAALRAAKPALGDPATPVEPTADASAATGTATATAAGSGMGAAGAPAAEAGMGAATAPDVARDAGVGMGAASAPAAGAGDVSATAAGAGIVAASTPAADAGEGSAMAGANPPDATAPDAAPAAVKDASAGTPAPTPLVPAGEGPRLRKALVALAHEDPVVAGTLLVGLLPAQAALLEGPLDYDLTVRGVGTFAVSVGDGSALVEPISSRRPRGEAAFHLAAEPAVLAELLAGERHKLGRFRRKAKVTGRRKQVRALEPLRGAPLSLAEAVRAGAKFKPRLLYRALAHAVDPAWTRGHVFTVAQQIVELAPRSWHITARDGEPLSVVERTGDAPADATVTMTRAAFERLLRDEPPALGDRPQIRGDREAVAVLKRWTDLARGA